MLSAAAVLVLGAVEASPAAAASPWWHLTISSRPTPLPAAAGSKGEVVFTAANLGTAAVEALENPVSLEAKLPPGIKPLRIESLAGETPGDVGNRGPLSKCPTQKKISEGKPLLCTFEGSFTNGKGETVGKSLPSYDQIEIRVEVEVLAAATAGEEAEFLVSGGAAPAATIRRALGLGGAPAFGLQSYELGYEAQGGGPVTQAGSHPFQQTVTLTLDQSAATFKAGSPPKYEAHVPALVRDVHTNLPQGLVGDPSPLPHCTLAQFLTVPPGGESGENSCPAATAVGATIVTVEEPGIIGLNTFTAPVFNIEPAFGEPARFGFTLPATPIVIDTALRSGGPHPEYDIAASATSISQTAALISSQVTFWGVPGDPLHDEARGTGCINEVRGLNHVEPCETSTIERPPAFLRLPTSCTGPLRSDTEVDSWPAPQTILDYVAFPALGGLDGCNQLLFNPSMAAEATTAAATTGSGLSFDLGFANEGLTSAGGAAESDLKKAVVTLPEGFTSNPSVAEGLKACSEAEYEAATVQVGTGCTGESKIGEVEIESPLVEGKKVSGGLYVAHQGENPYHNLLTLYLIARNEEIGVLVRQALKVTPNPVTGQLTTEVDNVPQLPFSHFHLAFRSGQRSPLITPPACGTFAVKAQLFPWSQPTQGVERESAFRITSGPEGQGCPSAGTPPFHPTLEAGTTNNAAGSYSPFYTRISRKDSEQEITHFSIKLPPGVSGKLAGVAKCSDAQIAAAKAREHEGGGAEELASPSCPASSEIGHTTVGTGVGNVLAYAPGKLYLAGPYHGSNLSIVSITAAKVGPFDLGTVVIREALKVNPETAQVSAEGAGSDPIPHIVDGIPVHLRDIRIYVDRPQFVLNPTNCERMSTASTVLGSGTNFASEADDVPVTVTSPFQAAGCASLGFKPKLQLSLSGPTKRAGLPKLKAVVTYPKGAQANIAKTVVTLPKSEFLEQGHIGSSCTRVQFNAGGGNGEQCPKNSLLGHARAITPLLEEPLEGPVYLRSNGGERKLPDLVAALHSTDIDIDLVGFISSFHKKGSDVSQIRNTFASVPDAPVERFTLELFGGKKGLLVNSQNLCKGTHKAISEFTGQNGKLYDTEPAVKAQCGKKGKKKGAKAKGGKKK